MELKRTLFSKEYGALRTVITDNDILFCAIDIARMLGYKRPDKAVADNCMNIRLYKIPTTGGDQYIRFITDDEAIRLARRCTLPGADRFCDALYSAIRTLEESYFANDDEADEELGDYDFEEPDSDDVEYGSDEDYDEEDDLDDMSDLSSNSSSAISPKSTKSALTISMTKRSMWRIRQSSVQTPSWTLS